MNFKMALSTCQVLPHIPALSADAVGISAGLIGLVPSLFACNQANIEVITVNNGDYLEGVDGLQ